MTTKNKLLRSEINYDNNNRLQIFMYLENSRVKEYRRLLQNAKIHKVVFNRWIRTKCKSAQK